MRLVAGMTSGAMEFFQEVEQVLARIAENPQFFTPHMHGRRKAPLMRFPFGIFYRVLPDHVRILAVCHDKRHPNYSARPR